MPLWLTLATLAMAIIFFIMQLSVFSRASILSDGYSYFDAWETIKGGIPTLCAPRSTRFSLGC